MGFLKVGLVRWELQGWYRSKDAKEDDLQLNALKQTSNRIWNVRT
jgi:hypothetical protein